MLRSLLVGLNGSEASRDAYEIALTWAGELKIPVTCLGVIDSSRTARIETAEGEGRVQCDTAQLTLERENVGTALKWAANRAYDLDVPSRIIEREGFPAAILGEEAQRHDLLILGRCLARNDLNNGPSDTLVEILSHSPRPIILGCRQIPRSSNVVIAYDGSVQAARTLQSFVSSGLYYGHPLHLVGVSDNPESMQDILGRAEDYLNAHSLHAERHVLPTRGTVADVLLDFERRISAGLLVIGVYGQPWYKDVIFGSVTKEMLARCQVPMFLNH